MHFLIVFCLVVAWYFPLRALISHWLYPDAKTGPRTSYSFVALAYEGVSKRTNEVSAALFSEHLEALRGRGYVPIKLEDVRQLLYEGKPVPQKAVLLTFDHGRKTSYFAADPILKSMGWKAVMFLWTHPIMNKDSAALLWPYVRIMSRSGTWELGAQSNNGFTMIAASPHDYLGHFMTTAKWLSEENRFETPVEFANRLAQDHEECLQIIRKETGMKPIAYAYPYGDFGQFESRAVFARRVNLNLSSKYYPLGFLSGNLAANTRYSDPKRLNRLRVKPEWAGEDLADFLDRSWPVEGATSSDTNAARLAAAWIVDWGAVKGEKGHMTLYAPAQNTGAKMWLAGSDLTKDFYSRVVFSQLTGQLGIYARAAADEESYVYLGLDSKGSVWLRQTQFGQDATRMEDEQNRDMGIWLRQKQVSLERFTLASSQVNVDTAKEHVLDMYARGPLLFVRLDGKPIFSERVLLRGDMKPGMMGLSVWSPDKGRAQVTISAVSLKPQERSVAAWESNSSRRDASVFRWIHQNAYNVTDISPPWIKFTPSGQIQKSVWNPIAYTMLARMYQFHLLPRVSVDDERMLTRLIPSELADRLAEIKAQGMFVRMDEIQKPTTQRITAWLQQCAADLRARGMELKVRLPASLETPVFVRSLLAMIPSIQIVAGPTSPLRASNSSGTNVTTTQLTQVPDPEQDKDMPIFYELNAIPEIQGEASPAVKISRLPQEGQAAFLAADYHKAIDLWQQWFKAEPNNPRPPMLIGDAFLRLNDVHQALTNYAASLDLDPGQIRLGLRRAGLLDTVGLTEESMNQLNMFARLFPDNPDIMLAQAEWLRRHDRGAEAIPIVQHIVQTDSNNFEAVALMLRLPISAPDYRLQMEALARIGTQPKYYYELGQAIWKYDLLSMPGSHVLVKLVQTIATQTKEPSVATLFARLQPHNGQVTDTFASGRVSDGWWLDGGEFQVEGGKLQVHTDETHTEATIRLLGSDHFHDAFVEAVVQRKAGSVWLYIRRTGTHMIRFGMDPAGKMFLQLWRGGHLTEQRTKTWTESKDPIRLRLEVRGDGIMGYANDQPAFASPMEVPPDFELGWVGLAINHTERGKAHAIFTRLSAGPLPPRIVVLPAFSGETDLDAKLNLLRQEINHVSDLAPRWFQLNTNGALVAQLGSDAKLLELFARYYRVRLLPVVDVVPGATLSADALIAQAAKNKLDGFVLFFAVMPPAAELAALDRALGSASLKVLAVAVDPDKNTGRIRSLAASSDLLPGAESEQDILVLPWIGKDGAHKLLNDLPTEKPAIISL
jgi:peptidoglycan/xylan/chitin deacetylase (PgdA/CDA1 family)